MRKWRDDTVFVPEVRELAKEWCIQRGLDPQDIPVDGYIEPYGDDQVRVEVFDRDENGTIKWNFDAADGEGRPYVKWQVVKGPMPHYSMLQEQW